MAKFWIFGDFLKKVCKHVFPEQINIFPKQIKTFWLLHTEI